MRRPLFAVMLFWVVLVRMEGRTFARNSLNNANIVSTLPAASAFTNTYGIYGTNFISIAPWTSQGIFYQGDSVVISNRIGTTVEVYDFHGNSVTNAAPPVTLMNLKMGHYFVQVDGNATSSGFGDRSQFSVWPNGYTNYPHADIGEPITFTVAMSNRFVRVAPGFQRLTGYWSIICSNSAHTNDFTIFDEYLHGGKTPTQITSGGPPSWPNPPVPLKVLDFQAEHYDMASSNYNYGYISPYVDQTNSLASFLNDFSLFCSNVAARYTNAFTYEILNEPSGSSMNFTNSHQDPYSYGGAYPASLAVSAAVQAIQFVCTNCQTWAPAVGGLRGVVPFFTNWYVRAGYTNVNAFSFHGGDMLYGPIDTILAYTNASIGGIWWPTDSSLECIAAIYGKPFAVTEAYPFSPDILGKTNSWWTTQRELYAPAYTSLPWTWQTLAFRFWKDLVEWRSTGVDHIQTWLQLWDKGPPLGYEGQDAYCGWDANNDLLGCGPLPSVDGEAMISWWLTGATPVMSWLSGSLLRVLDPLGGYTTGGTPGLHFHSWVFTNGTTNTFIWADEGITVTTNFGVGLTDMFSNQWNGPIGIEPVIAWGWPNNSMGGSFSIVPAAAFSASPSYGPAPMTVTFTDGSTGAITNRFWQFGDGFVTNTPELTVAHQYTAPGSNTVQLIVSGPSGAGTNVQPNMIVATPFPPPLLGGSSTGLPPFTGGSTGGNTAGSNNVPPSNGGSATNWRFLITY